MKPSSLRTVIAGIGGGIAMNVAMLFIFRLIGFGWRGKGILLFLLVFSFWEFFTPFNQFGEPLPLIGLELLFWAIIALADGFIIAFIIEKGTLSK